eukprot:2176213-Rhodomonas_salina.1
MGVDEELQVLLRHGQRPTPMGMLHGGETTQGTPAGPSRLDTRRSRLGRSLPGMARHHTIGVDVQCSPPTSDEGTRCDF